MVVGSSPTRTAMIYNANTGILLWDGDVFKCISGPYGKGVIDYGKWRVKKHHVVEGHLLRDSFRDPETGIAFFIPLIPLFETPRTGIGIHPDGGVRGTLGCIGLQSSALRFWNKWVRMPMKKRPNWLTVRCRS